MQRFGLRAVTFFAVSKVCLGVAHAQTATPNPPQFSLIDPLSVDVFSHSTSTSVEDISIGSGSTALRHSFIVPSGTITPGRFYDNFTGVVTVSIQGPCLYQVSIGEMSDCFLDGNGSQSQKKDGATFQFIATNTYQYIDRQGVVYYFEHAPGAIGIAGSSNVVMTKISYPSGLIIHIKWSAYPTGQYSQGLITSVSSNNGLMLHYDYVDSPTFGAGANYKVLNRIVTINRSLSYCDPDAITCPNAQYQKSSVYSYSPRCTQPRTDCWTLSINDQAGQISQFRLDELNRMTAMRPKESQIFRYTYTHCKSGHYITSGVQCYITPNGETTLQSAGNKPFESYDLPMPPLVMLATDNGRQWSYSVRGAELRDRSIDDQGRTYLDITSALLTTPNSQCPDTPCTFVMTRVSFLGGAKVIQYSGDYSQRIMRYTGDGYDEQYTYDARGNILTATKYALANSGNASIVRSASYDMICANMITCNQPNTVTDANENTSSYVYDTTTGNLLSETGPPVNGTSPTRRLQYAKIKESYIAQDGTRQEFDDGIAVLMQESTCIAGATVANGCSNAGDEFQKSFQYGGAGSSNKLWLRGVMQDSLTGGLKLLSCYAYNASGDTISKTSPRANLTSCPL